MTEKKKSYFRLYLILAAIFGVGICVVALLPLSVQTALHRIGQKGMHIILSLLLGDDLTAKIGTPLITLFLFAIGNALFTWFVWLASCPTPDRHYKALAPAFYSGTLVTIVCGLLKWISSGKPASWTTLAFLFTGCVLAVALIGFFWFCWDKFPKVVNREVVRYFLFGIFATVANLVTFNLCYYVFGLNNGTTAATIIAWVAAVIFAFFTNKVFVFESKTETFKDFFREAVLFFAARLFSCFVTIAGMFLLVDLTHWFSAGVGKIINCIIELTLNYVFSKLIIFTNKEKKTETTEE